MRVLLAIGLGLPVSLLLAGNAALVTGGRETGGAAMLVVWLLSWPAVALYASRAVTPRRVFSRTAVIYAVGAFALPVSALIFTLVAGAQVVGAEEDELARGFAVIGAGLAGTVIVAVAAVFGLFTGVIAAMLAYLARRNHEPSRFYAYRAPPPPPPPRSFE